MRRPPPSEIPFFDRSRQIANNRQILNQAVARILDSGRYVLGESVEEFEQEFAEFCGARFAVGVASGTDAITLALAAMDIGPGDEVITPANTCVPTIAGILATGAVPVLADVDEDTATLAAASVERALTKKTAAIVPVHLYGQCADMDTLRAIANDADVRIVEDAAQAHGAGYGDSRAGTLADAAAFSFYPTKNLGAIGDGGAVVTDDDQIAERVRLLRNYGYEERDNAVIAGRNSRLDELQAALLLSQLGNLELANRRRREHAHAYLADLREAPIGLPVEAPGRLHAWHLFAIRSASRDDLRQALQERGVGTLVHYPRAIHQQPAFKELTRPGELSVSERLCSEVLSLPLYPELTDRERETVVAALQDSLSALNAS